MDRGGSGPANGATVHTADTSALELLSDVKQQTLSNNVVCFVFIVLSNTARDIA